MVINAIVYVVFFIFMIIFSLKGCDEFDRTVENENAVRNATEERKRSSNCKPILDQDGLIWQRSSYQVGIGVYICVAH